MAYVQRAVTAIGLIVVVASAAHGQQRAAGGRLPVHILADAQGDSVTRAAHFTAELLRYELLRINALEPHVVNDRSRACTVSGGPQMQIQKASQEYAPTNRGINSDELRYWVVLSFTSAGSATTVDAELHKCGARGDSVLLHETRAIPARDPLSEMLAFSERMAETVRASMPRVQVSFTIDSAKAKVRRVLQTTLWSELLDSESLQPTEANGTYRANVRFEPAGDDTLNAIVQLRSAARGMLGYFHVSSPKGDPGELAELIAAELQGRIDEDRFRPLFANASGSVTPDVSALVRQARTALCIPNATGCRTNVDVASAALSAAMGADSNSVEVRSLVGAMESLRGNRTRGISVLEQTRRSQAWAQADATKRAALFWTLGTLYRDVGNYGLALSAFDSVAALQPTAPAITAERARAARALGRSAQALNILAAAANAGDTSAVRMAKDLVNDLSDEDVEDHGEDLVRACAVYAPLRESCATVISRVARSTDLELPVLKQVLLATVGLRPDDPTHVAHTYISIAARYTGTIRHPLDPQGRPATVVDGFVPDSADRYLQLAQTAANSGGGASARTREWLGRVRALYKIGTRDYAGAVDEALRARAAAATDEATYVVGQARFALAMAALRENNRPRATELAGVIASEMRGLIERGYTPAHYYYREASHVLGRDAEVKSYLEAKLAAAPNPEVLGSLVYLCGEHQKNYLCALDGALRLAALGESREYVDSLQVVEYATLADKNDVGEAYYRALTDRVDDPCFMAVRSLYGTWLASNRGDADEVGRRTQEYLRNMTAHRNRARASVCWVFGGARTRLETSTLPNRTLITTMIRAIENRAAPLPGNNR